MTTREYYQIDAANQFPGSLSHADMVDAIANMNETEWRAFNEAFVEYNDMIVGTIIRQSICRQNAKAIEQVGTAAYEAHEEANKEDQLERKHEARLERAA